MAIEIRELQQGDERAVLDALNDFCRSERPGVDARTMEAWRWAYEENPAGRRAWIAVEDGRIVAHYAALPHAVWLAGGLVGKRRLADEPEQVRGPLHDAGRHA